MAQEAEELVRIESAPVVEPPPVVEWTAVAMAGELVLGQSAAEYAVYNRQYTFGRWPRTDEGYQLAVQTYDAHRQSLAHGIAFTAAGYQDPERLGLPTEPAIVSITYAAPLSYVGSTRRILTWATKAARRTPSLAALTWVGSIVALVAVWIFLVFWYALIFGIFGIFVIPYRLIRRSQRKSVHVQRTSLATQQAMLQQMSEQLAAQQQLVAQQLADQVLADQLAANEHAAGLHVAGRHVAGRQSAMAGRWPAPVLGADRVPDDLPALDQGDTDR
jgi:hypothetical protein